MLRENVRRRLIAVGHLIKHTEESKMSNLRKSSFYRSAIILLETIVECLTYELVKKKSPSPHVVFSKNEYKEKHKIPSTVLGTSNNLYLCERIVTNVLVDDNDVGFGKLIIFLKNNQFITPSEFNLLNWTRIQRNKIHLQGLSTCDTGYTSLKINKLSKIIIMLFDKLSL